MDFGFLAMVIKLVFALGLTLGLMFLSFRLMGTKLSAINNNKYVKVIERVQITKENAILIVKIGQRGYVISNTAERMETLSELSEEEINIIEEDKKKAAQELADNYNNLILKSKKSLDYMMKKIKSKEEKHEK